MPPLENNSSEPTRNLRHKTEHSIAEAANWRSERFLASPAHHLLGGNHNVDKLKNIFNDAAQIAFKLWTRRIAMECVTIHDFDVIEFDAESIYFEPDNVVRHSHHETHFKGQRVTLLAHPLLKIYGTDEAKDYDQERVWAKGIVWIDSKVNEASSAEQRVALK